MKKKQLVAYYDYDPKRNNTIIIAKRIGNQFSFDGARNDYFRGTPEETKLAIESDFRAYYHLRGELTMRKAPEEMKRAREAKLEQESHAIFEYKIETARKLLEVYAPERERRKAQTL